MKAVVYPRDAILTLDQVAKGLGVSLSAAKRADLPTIYITPKVPRYLWGQVLDALAGKAQ